MPIVGWIQSAAATKGHGLSAYYFSAELFTTLILWRLPIAKSASNSINTLQSS
jgi:hypothetical protein